jgi:O-antigen ligase
MIELSRERRQTRVLKFLESLLPTLAIVVVLGWILGKLVVTCSIWYAVALALATVLGFVLVNRLQYGILVYFFVALFAFGQSPAVQSPNSNYRAGLMPSQVLLIFFTLLWLGKKVFGGSEKIVKTPLNPALAVLSIVSILSFASSNLLRGTRELLFHQLIVTQIAEVGLLLCSVFAFLVTANGLKDQSVIKATFIPIVLVSLYFVPRAFTRCYMPIPIIWGNFLLNAGIVLVYGRLLFEDLRPYKKIGFIIILGILIVASYCNLSWVSGWMATTISIVVVTYCRSKKATAALIAAGLFVLFVYPGLFYQVQDESAAGGDYDRFTIWHDAYKMFTSVNPVLGVGPGNYHPYVYYHSSIWIAKGNTYTTAHSNYIQMASEMGLLGFAAFLYVVTAGIWTGFRAVRRGPPEMKWITVGGLAMFTGIALSSVFGDYLFPSRGNNGLMSFGTTVYSWLMLGAAVAASRSTGKEQ